MNEFINDSFLEQSFLNKAVTQERKQFFLAAQEALDDASDGVCSFETALISLVAVAFSAYSKSIKEDQDT